MDDALVETLLDRDWHTFCAQAARFGFGQPTRGGTRIDLPGRPVGANQEFRAVLLCDGYDAQAPLLDFADPQDPTQLGAAFWPRMANAPINSITCDGRQLPFICTPGTRGYHLHPSHVAEHYARTTWRLARVAGLLGTFLITMGPYQGRGLG